MRPNVRWPVVLTQRGGQTKVYQFFLLCQQKIFWPKGAHGRLGQGVNTPLETAALSSSSFIFKTSALLPQGKQTTLGLGRDSRIWKPLQR